MTDLNKVPAEVLDILGKLHANGFRSFIVGGSVRDILLNKIPKDFDICTAATPEDVKRIFEKVIDTGLKFGTVTVLCERTPVEITTFRKAISSENGPGQGAAEFSQCEAEDVKTRDFTINALLFDGQQIVDYVNGLTDLKHKVIRAVGEPDCRFQEDALRMLRAVRLSCQLGFIIEESTLSCIAPNAHLIENIANERIREELIKIILSEEPSRGIRLMRKAGLLRYVLPELQSCYKFEQCNLHHDKGVFEHIMAVLEHTPKNLVVRMAALLHETHYVLSRQILSRLKFNSKTIDSVSILVKENMSRFSILRKASVKKLINRVGLERIQLLIDLQIADEAGSVPPHDFRILERLREEVTRIVNEKEPVSVRDLAVNGNDLIQMGVKPGPQVGAILDRLLEKVLNNPELNTKEELLRNVSELI